LSFEGQTENLELSKNVKFLVTLKYLLLKGLFNYILWWNIWTIAWFFRWFLFI